MESNAMLHMVGMLEMLDSISGKTFQSLLIGATPAVANGITAEPGVQLLLSQLQPFHVETYPVGPPSVLP